MDFKTLIPNILRILSQFDNIVSYRYEKSFENLAIYFNELNSDEYKGYSADLIYETKLRMFLKLLKTHIPKTPIYDWEREIINLVIDNENKQNQLIIKDKLIPSGRRDFYTDNSDTDWYIYREITVDQYFSFHFKIEDFQKKNLVNMFELSKS